MRTRLAIDARDWAARRAAAKLARLPNVTHITVGAKIKRGRATGLRALKVHVVEKIDVARRAAVPRFVFARSRGGERLRFRTDVIATGGVPIALGMRAGNRVQSFDNELGVAGFMFAKGTHDYVLTNAHVVCNVAQAGATGIAKWRDVPAGPPRTLGPVVYTTRIDPALVARSDAAVVRAVPGLIEVRRAVGLDASIELMGELDRNTNYLLAFKGEFIGVSSGERVVGAVPIEVDGVIVRYEGFWQFDCPTRRAAPGLSGALLFKSSPTGPIACGLVFGGIPDRRLFAYPFKPLFERAFAQLP